MLIDENAHVFSSDPISFLFTFLRFDRLVLLLFERSDVSLSLFEWSDWQFSFFFSNLFGSCLKHISGKVTGPFFNISSSLYAIWIGLQCIAMKRATSMSDKQTYFYGKVLFSFFQWKYTVQFVKYCLDSVIYRIFDIRGSHLCYGWKMTFTALLCSSSYISSLVLDKRLWLVGPSRTGQNYYVRKLSQPLSA